MKKSLIFSTPLDLPNWKIKKKITFRRSDRFASEFYYIYLSGVQERKQKRVFCKKISPKYFTRKLKDLA
ncbi:MAG: hypothetical protein A2X86_00400 [Bdellovibrionales bacterium GWA2_49_15]|nr:MAG: hypothetical protein A2X86_00400 [Bdellovibrionales bacterium GWA2_49_15]HAZ14503.1 hypothetical protein [Bdellovibrionales bacterium]